MSAYLFDIDGTVVKWHTNEWLPGAVEMLTDSADKGHQSIFITMRGINKSDADNEWSTANTDKLLSQLPFKYRVLYAVAPERVVVDDNKKGGFVHHKQNSTWEGVDLVNYKDLS